MVPHPPMPSYWTLTHQKALFHWKIRLMDPLVAPGLISPFDIKPSSKAEANRRRSFLNWRKQFLLKFNTAMTDFETESSVTVAGGTDASFIERLATMFLETTYGLGGLGEVEFREFVRYQLALINAAIDHPRAELVGGEVPNFWNSGLRRRFFWHMAVYRWYRPKMEYSAAEIWARMLLSCRNRFWRGGVASFEDFLKPFLKLVDYVCGRIERRLLVCEELHQEGAVAMRTQEIGVRQYLKGLGMEDQPFVELEGDFGLSRKRKRGDKEADSPRKRANVAVVNEEAGRELAADSPATKIVRSRIPVHISTLDMLKGLENGDDRSVTDEGDPEDLEEIALRVLRRV